MAVASEPATLTLAGPLHRKQLRALTFIVMLSALDGFDVLAITFAAPSIAAEWTIGPTALGAVISAGLVGMAAGSLLIGPLADKFGRRPVMLLCLTVMTIGTLLTAMAGSVAELSICRLVTGLGIGGMFPALSALASEHANEATRDRSIAMMVVGYPCGGLLGGLIAAPLIQTFDWRALFLFASALTALFAIAAYIYVPETIEFLARRQPRDALKRLNQLLVAFGREPVAALPPLPRSKPAPSLIRVFSRPYLIGTLIIVMGFVFQSLAFYFIQGWLPKLLADQGLSLVQAINAAALFNLGGIFGGLLVGWLVARISLRRLLLIMASGFTLAMLAFSLRFTDIMAIRAIVIWLGLCGSSAIVVFYAIFARFYPADLRSTGSGVVLGFGRSGAAIGPLLGGALIEFGLEPAMVVRVIAGFAVAAGLLVLSLRPARSEEQKS